MNDTPLHAEHARLGARFVEFGGWRMPVVYCSIVDEHNAVRQRAGLFDLNHMGRLVLSGRRATENLDRLVPARLTDLKPGQARYTFFLTDEGTFVDDVIVYRRPDDWLVVVNAGNRVAVLEWLAGRFDGRVADRTLDIGMLAVQGRRAAELLDGVTNGTPSRLAPFGFASHRVLGVESVIARTGYTGEDGFELFFLAEHNRALFCGLLEAGRSLPLAACGLGARDTLRLEAAMSLYGHEIDRRTNPVEARLSWAIDWEKDFVGKGAIRKVKEEGPPRRLVGLVVDSKRIPRESHPVFAGERLVGQVTSGTASPTLNLRIALAYVAGDVARPGGSLEVDVRGHRQPARIVRLPFYRRT